MVISFYGVQRPALWGQGLPFAKRHDVSPYGSLQGADRAAFLAGPEKRIKCSPPPPNTMSPATRHIAISATVTTSLDMATKLHSPPQSGLSTPPNFALNSTLDIPHRHLRKKKKHYPAIPSPTLIVRVPDQKFVYSGDLVSPCLSRLLRRQGTCSGWRNTLKTFASWDKRHPFVPGHGPACGQEGIRKNLRDLLRRPLLAKPKKCTKAGVPVADSTRQYSFPKNSKP